MQRVAFNNYLCGGLTILFALLVVAMAYFTVRMALRGWRQPAPTSAETEYREAPLGVSYAVAH